MRKIKYLLYGVALIIILCVIWLYVFWGSTEDNLELHPGVTLLGMVHVGEDLLHIASGIEWAHSSRLLAVPIEGEQWIVKIYSERGEIVSKFSVPNVESLHWSPNDKFLAASDGSSVYIFDVRNKTLTTFIVESLSEIESLQWKNDYEVFIHDFRSIAVLNLNEGVDYSIRKSNDKFIHMVVGTNGQYYLIYLGQIVDGDGNTVYDPDGPICFYYYNNQSNIYYFTDKSHLMKAFNVNSSQVYAIPSNIVLDNLGRPGQAVTNDDQYHLFAGTLGDKTIELINLRNENERRTLIGNIVAYETATACDNKTFAVFTFYGDIYFFTIKGGFENLFVK